MPRKPQTAVETDVQEGTVALTEEEVQAIEAEQEEVTPVVEEKEEVKGVEHVMLLNVLHDGVSYKKGESVSLTKGLVRLFRQKGFIA